MFDAYASYTYMTNDMQHQYRHKIVRLHTYLNRVISYINREEPMLLLRRRDLYCDYRDLPYWINKHR